MWFPLSVPVCAGLNWAVAGTEPALVRPDGHVYEGLWGLAWVGVGPVLRGGRDARDHL